MHNFKYLLIAVNLDTRPPVVTIKPLPSITNEKVITIRWTSNEFANYRCAVDDINNAVNCGSGLQGTWRTPVMRDGEHTFYLLARDSAGNRATSVSQIWRVGEWKYCCTFLLFLFLLCFFLMFFF